MALRSVARAMAQARSAAPARRNLSSIIDADSGKLATQGYHYTSMALIPLTPLAFVLSPSSYCLPVDLALGVVIPLHGEFGETPGLTAPLPLPPPHGHAPAATCLRRLRRCRLSLPRSSSTPCAAAHIGMNYVMTDYVKKFVGKAAVGASQPPLSPSPTPTLREPHHSSSASAAGAHPPQPSPCSQAPRGISCSARPASRWRACSSSTCLALA